MVHLSVPIYPVVTFNELTLSAVDNSDGAILSINTKLWFSLMYFGHNQHHLLRHPLLSPIKSSPVQDPKTFPRTHVITAELDVLRDEGEYYVDYLRSSGVNVSHKRYNGTVHAFFGATVLPHGKQALHDVSEIIRTHLLH